MPDDTEAVIRALYQQARRDPEQHLNSPSVDDDFSFSMRDLGRFRANVLRQRGSLAAVLRVIRFGLPDPAALGRKLAGTAANKRWLHHPKAETFLAERVALLQRVYKR